MLKLKFRKYPSIHTNYIISHSTILQYNHNIWYGSYAEKKYWTWKTMISTGLPYLQFSMNSHSPEAQAWNLAMFGNNRFLAFCISSRGIDGILPGWELASGLTFSESKMAALKSIFLNNSRSKGNIMINHVSIMHYLVAKSSSMIILDHLVSPLWRNSKMAATYIMKM